MNRANWNSNSKALWDYCQRKPDAVEDHPWDEVVFKVKGNIFAFLGRPGGEDKRAGVTVKARPEELNSLLAMPCIKRASYIGRFGWVSLSIEDDTLLELAFELIDNSYELIATKSRRRKSATKKTSRSSKGRKI